MTRRESAPLLCTSPFPLVALLTSQLPAPAHPGYLYHQKDMLQDRGRMNAYRNAVMRNPGCFEGKVGANPPSARAHAERPEAVCELVRLAHNISYRPFAGPR